MLADLRAMTLRAQLYLKHCRNADFSPALVNLKELEFEKIFGFSQNSHRLINQDQLTTHNVLLKSP
jgi:hypothetical protein